MNYLAIDQATTSGIAWKVGNSIYCTEFVGTPNELFDFANNLRIITNSDTILLEKFHSLRNIKVVTSLMERTGYLVYSFAELGVNVEKVDTNSARKLLGFKKHKNIKSEICAYFQQYDKDITDNCSDAIVLLCSKYELSWKEFDVFFIKPKGKLKQNDSRPRSKRTKRIVP